MASRIPRRDGGTEDAARHQDLRRRGAGGRGGAGDGPRGDTEPGRGRGAGSLGPCAPRHARGDQRRDRQPESESPAAHDGAGAGPGLRFAHRGRAPARRSCEPARPGRRAPRPNGRGLGADRRRVRGAQGMDGPAQRGRRGLLARCVDRPRPRGPHDRRPLDRVGARARRAVSGGRRADREPGGRGTIRRDRGRLADRQQLRRAAQATHWLRDSVFLARHRGRARPRGLDGERVRTA